jgi:hypothetical protein
LSAKGNRRVSLRSNSSFIRFLEIAMMQHLLAGLLVALGSKTWYYFPTSSEPFTTVIPISGGLVFSLDRVRQF